MGNCYNEGHVNQSFSIKQTIHPSIHPFVSESVNKSLLIRLSVRLSVSHGSPSVGRRVNEFASQLGR